MRFAPPAETRSPNPGLVPAVRRTQANSAQTAALQGKALLPLRKLPPNGSAPAEKPTQASSAQNAARPSPQLPRSTSATSAAGNLLILPSLPNSVPNAEILLMRTIWFDKRILSDLKKYTKLTNLEVAVKKLLVKKLLQ